MTSEKRQSTRANVHTVIDVIDLASDDSLGHLVNISEGGFMVRSHCTLPLNKLFQIKLIFTDENMNRTELELGAESLWGQEMPASASYWYGFQIFDISEKNIQAISILSENWKS